MDVWAWVFVVWAVGAACVAYLQRLSIGGVHHGDTKWLVFNLVVWPVPVGLLVAFVVVLLFAVVLPSLWRGRRTEESTSQSQPPVLP